MLTSGFSLNRAATALCFPLMCAALLVASGKAQSFTPETGNKVGSLQGLPETGDTLAASSITFKVHPQTKTYAFALVEYNPEKCTEISPGAWTVTTAPKRGTNEFGFVTGTLGNGDCPGVTFVFGAIYYTWTSAVSTTPTDSFGATWTSPDFTGPYTFGVTLIIPKDFKQVGPGTARADGVLHFNYSWASTSGALADLSQCEVGEHVAYPGGNPYKWPKPPFDGSTTNPTVLSVAATDGVAQDNHSHTAFIKPYKAASFDATQEYRSICRHLNTTNFPGYGNIIIARHVADTTGKGCWTYTITKSGAKASTTLPGVTAAECTRAAPEEAEPVSEADNNASELGLSIAPDVTFGLHEPISVDLTVFNRSTQTVVADLGLNKQSNLEFTIEEPSGNVVVRRLSSEGFGGVGEVSLEPGAKFVKPLLLNEWHDFEATGTYYVTVALLPAAPGEDAATIEHPHAEFTVNVTPRDAAQLQRIAEELADLAINGKTLAISMDAAKALSYMRDRQAVGSLARVLQQGTLVEHYAVDGLVQIGTPEAIAALEAAQNHPDEDVRTAVRSALEALQQGPQKNSGPKD